MAGPNQDVDRTQPLRRSDVATFPLDDELVIYDPENGESFLLNETGRVIWEWCDGTRTVAQIAAELSKLHGVERNLALVDVTELVESLTASGLLAS